MIPPEQLQPLLDLIDAADKPAGVAVALTMIGVHLDGTGDIVLTAETHGCSRPLAPTIHGQPQPHHHHAQGTGRFDQFNNYETWLPRAIIGVLALLDTATTMNHHAATAPHN